jgi:hypothetical protein
LVDAARVTAEERCAGIWMLRTNTPDPTTTLALQCKRHRR